MDDAAEADAGNQKPWWREGSVACVIVLVLGAYFLRAGDLPIQGEEPTRAQIAYEMVQNDSWVVPLQQGEPFLTRPPLQNWLIAASCLMAGSWEPWAVRLHSLAAVLLATLLVYGYSRQFLSELGALAAAAVFATMGHMLTKGAQAETDALFILFVSGSLLVWHWAIVRGWRDVWTFSAGYALMAFASLTKGPQAPAYFLGAIVGYLLLTRQWRRLFSFGHLCAILVGAAIHLLWIIPFALQVGWAHALSPWLGDGGNGSINGAWNIRATLVHGLTYPAEVGAAILPWSALLLVYLRRDMRAAIGTARPQVVFLLTCLAIALPTCWIPQGGLVRYFAPMYPCVAVLIGLAIQRGVEAAPMSVLRRDWRLFLTVMAGAMFLAGGLVVARSSLRVLHVLNGAWAEPPLGAVLFAGVFVALALLVLRHRQSGESSRARLAVLAVAGAVAVALSGVYTNNRMRRSENPATAIQELKEQLPPGQTLVCLGDWNFDALFAYHYNPGTIRPAPWPTAESDCAWTYFCFRCHGDSRPKLPFSWQEIGAVSVDRFRHDVPESVFVVGRRLPAPSAAIANGPPARLVQR